MNINIHSDSTALRGDFSKFYSGVQRPHSIENDQLQEQKQHFLEAKSLVSSVKLRNKDVHSNWQINSLVKSYKCGISFGSYLTNQGKLLCSD